MKYGRFGSLPKYSLTAHIVGVVIICVLSSLIIAWKLHGKDLQETIINTAVMLVGLWLYFTYVLYGGMRFDHGRVKWKWPDIGGLPDVPFSEHLSWPDLSSVGDLGSLDGCAGIIIGILVSILAVITVIILAYVGVEVGTFVGLLIAVPLYWLFRLSARLVIVNTRTCSGNISRSILVGLKYAFLYAAIIGVLFFAVNGLVTKSA